MADPQTIGGVAGAATAASAFLGKYLFTIIRANMRNKVDQVKRDAKYIDDCEQRYNKLSDTVDAMRKNYETQTVAAFIEATKQIAMAAEVQREGNSVQRDHNRLLDRVCKVLEVSADKTPIDGTSTKGIIK